MYEAPRNLVPPVLLFSRGERVRRATAVRGKRVYENLTNPCRLSVRGGSRGCLRRAPERHDDGMPRRCVEHPPILNDASPCSFGSWLCADRTVRRACLWSGSWRGHERHEGWPRRRRRRGGLLCRWPPVPSWLCAEAWPWRWRPRVLPQEHESRISAPTGRGRTGWRCVGRCSCSSSAMHGNTLQAFILEQPSSSPAIATASGICTAPMAQILCAAQIADPVHAWHGCSQPARGAAPRGAASHLRTGHVALRRRRGRQQRRQLPAARRHHAEGRAHATGPRAASFEITKKVPRER